MNIETWTRWFKPFLPLADGFDIARWALMRWHILTADRVRPQACMEVEATVDTLMVLAYLESDFNTFPPA